MRPLRTWLLPDPVTSARDCRAASFDRRAACACREIEAGTDVVVVDAAASFKASPRFDDLLDIEMTITRLGSSSMTSEFAERRNGVYPV